MQAIMKPINSYVGALHDAAAIPNAIGINDINVGILGKASTPSNSNVNKTVMMGIPHFDVQVKPIPIRSRAMLYKIKQKGKKHQHGIFHMFDSEKDATYVLEKLAMNKQMDGISNAGIIAIVSQNRCCIDIVLLLEVNSNPNSKEPANRYIVNTLDGDNIRVATAAGAWSL